jgi:hypothetical protein
MSQTDSTARLRELFCKVQTQLDSIYQDVSDVQDVVDDIEAELDALDALERDDNEVEPFIQLTISDRMLCCQPNCQRCRDETVETELAG